MTIESVTLLGSSSGRNAGDAALIAGIIDSVDAACGRELRWEIPTIRPSYIVNNYRGRVVPISMMPWSLSVKMMGLPTYRSVMRTDLSLIFDAILFDRALFNPLFNYLSTVSLLLPLAKKKGHKLGYFNVGVGPVTTPRGKDMLRRLTDKMDFVTVRDADSYRILQEIGVSHPRIAVTADAALNMIPASPSRAEEILRIAGFAPGEEVLCLNISKYIDTWAGAGTEPMGRERFVTAYSNALNAAAKEIGVPVLFICTQHHDVELTKAIMDRLVTAPKKGIITNIDYNHAEIMAVLGRVSLLCGMRLHATILASASLTPILGLPHQPKVQHYFRTLGLEDRILTFKQFTEESFRDFLVDGWRSRSAIRARLEQSIPLSKRKALIAAEIIAAMSRGEDLDAVFLRLREEQTSGDNRTVSVTSA